MNELVSNLSLVVTAIVAPVVGLLVWTIKKLVQAQIDHVNSMTKAIDSVNGNMHAIEIRFDSLTNNIEELTQQVELLILMLKERIKERDGQV